MIEKNFFKAFASYFCAFQCIPELGNTLWKMKYGIGCFVFWIFFLDRIEKTISHFGDYGKQNLKHFFLK